MPIGKIEPFDLHSKQWSAYVRRVNQYMLCNEIKTELKVATLITLVGEPTYNLMCDLCAPANPEDKTFNELQKLVADHLEPQRSVIAERHVFRLRRQKVGEPLSEYLQNLKHLAATCQFGTALEENLRDQFVSGLSSDDMRSRLFAEKDITYKKAVELALALEAAEKHAEASAMGTAGSWQSSTAAAGANGRDGGGSGSGIHAVRAAAAARGPRSAPPAAAQAALECWRCGKPHRADKCRFKNYSCDKCQRKGHLKVMCKTTTNRGHNFMEDELDNELHNILAISQGDEPYFLNVNIEGKLIRCEVDTGSKISAINEGCYKKFFSHCYLYDDQIKLYAYTGSSITAAGYIIVNASIDNVPANNLKLYVIKNGGRPLLGRDWMRRFNINQLQVNQIKTNIDRDFHKKIIEIFKSDYQQVFTKKLGRCKREIRLQLTDNEPIYVRARPVPLALRAPVERELERLQAEGSIYPIEHSDYGTPIVPVVKASGKIRICGDYKTTINSKLKRNFYPLPRIEELFAALSGGQEFSKIDLTTAYMQVPLHKDSQACTAITTHIGTFVFRRTPYGLCCVPEKFQKIMEETLRGLPNTVVFLDDICVTGSDRETHVNNLRAAIERLKEMGLTVNIEKCSFLQDSVSYLGFVIDKEGLHPDLSKVEAILKAPRPSNVSQLKAFLGLLNYYGKFIPNLSTLLHPLHLLLKKDTPWVWTEKCEDTFNQTKRYLSSDKVLVHYNQSLPLVVSVDSSSYGIGAILAHKYTDGSERPISCASRTLTDTEKNYSQLDKEALAILYGVEKHHQYLYGRSFILKTDHKPLTYIFGPKGGIPQTAASRLQRWAVKLAAYDFEVEYVSSKNNSNADALSRLPLQTADVKGMRVNINYSYLNVIEETLPIGYKDIAYATKRDKLLSKIYGYIMFGWPQKDYVEEEKYFYNRRSELYVEHGCILYKYRIVVPALLQEQILSEIHNGHLGVIKMKSIARNYVYWPNVDKDIERICRECIACRNVRDAPPQSCLHPWEFPAAPWQRLHSDFAQLNGKYYIVTVDAHSKWIDTEEIRSTSARDTIKYFRNLFSKFGLPLQLVTDNGPPFQSTEFEDFCKKNLVRHTTSSPYRPQGNGAAENAVKTIKKTIKKAICEGQDIHTALSRFLFQYRNCEHATTGVAPAVALLGHRLRSRLDALRPSTTDVVRDAQEKQIEEYRGLDRQFRVGETVLARDYSTNKNKWTEGSVTSKTGPVSYNVELNKGSNCRGHVDQLLPYTRNRFSSTYNNDTETESDLSLNKEGEKLNKESFQEPTTFVSGDMELEKNSSEEKRVLSSHPIGDESETPTKVSDRAKRAARRNQRQIDITGDEA